MSEERLSICNSRKIDFGLLIRAQNNNLYFDWAIRETECTSGFKIVHKQNVEEGTAHNYD